MKPAPDLPRRSRSPANVPTPPLGDALEFMRLLWDAQHALEAASKRLKLRAGLTTSQRLVLRLVDRFPGITATALAGVLRVHPSTITGIVQRLEGRRLLLRKLDGADRRRNALVLTAAGRESAAEAEDGIEDAVCRVLASAEPAAVQQVRSMLSALARELS